MQERNRLGPVAVIAGDDLGVGQTRGDRAVDIPALSVGHAAIEFRRVAARTGGGQPGGHVIRHDDADQAVGRREQRPACAEQLAGAAPASSK